MHRVLRVPSAARDRLAGYLIYQERLHIRAFPGVALVVGAKYGDLRAGSRAA